MEKHTCFIDSNQKLGLQHKLISLPLTAAKRKTIERNMFFTDAVSATTLYLYKHRLKYVNLGLLMGQIPRHPLTHH